MGGQPTRSASQGLGDVASLVARPWSHRRRSRRSLARYVEICANGQLQLKGAFAPMAFGGSSRA